MEKICDSYDLMGASYIFETHDLSASQFFWRRSIELRATNQGVWWWSWWYITHFLINILDYLDVSHTFIQEVS